MDGERTPRGEKRIHQRVHLTQHQRIVHVVHIQLRMVHVVVNLVYLRGIRLGPGQLPGPPEGRQRRQHTAD